MKTIKLLIIAISVIALNSCALTMNPDGSKTATVDAPTAMRMIEVIAAK